MDVTSTLATPWIFARARYWKLKEAMAGAVHSDEQAVGQAVRSKRYAGGFGLLFAWL